jgi:hypothetical protein
MKPIYYWGDVENQLQGIKISILNNDALEKEKYEKDNKEQEDNRKS